MHKGNTNQTNTVCRPCRLSTNIEKTSIFLDFLLFDLTLNQPPGGASVRHEKKPTGAEEKTKNKKKKEKFTIFRLKATNVFRSSSSSLRAALHIKMKRLTLFCSSPSRGLVSLPETEQGRAERDFLQVPGWRLGLFFSAGGGGGRGTVFLLGPFGRQRECPRALFAPRGFFSPVFFYHLGVSVLMFECVSQLPVCVCVCSFVCVCVCARESDQRRALCVFSF